MKIFELLKNWYLRKFKTESLNIINNGYIEEEIDERDYVFGATGQKVVVREDGQWSEIFTPKSEHQSKRNVDVMACVTFSLMNLIEFLGFYKWGYDWNKSDRYIAKASNTTRNGNSMRNVIDTVRKVFGVVDEEDWAFEDSFTWNEYYKDIPANIIDKGQDWLKSYNVEYSSIVNNKKLMMEALKYSPLWVAGFAWALSNGLYRSWGTANHAFIIIGYKEGEYWLAFDSYSPFIKKLDWDFNFAYMKGVYLTKKEVEFDWDEMEKLVDKGIKYILLLEPYEIYNDGAYEIDLENKKLTPKTLKEAADNWVIMQSQNGALQTRTRDTFVKLLK